VPVVAKRFGSSSSLNRGVALGEKNPNPTQKYPDLENQMPAKEPYSEDFLAEVLNAIPSLVFVVDKDVQIHEYNTAAAALLPPNRSTILMHRGGEALHCLYSHDVPEGCGRSPYCKDCVIRNSVTAALQGNKVVRRQHKLELIRDGNTLEIYALITASPFLFQGNQLVLLIIEDVSESREALSEISRLNKFQDLVLNTVDHIDAMVAYWDINQVCLFANSAYYTWFGRTRDQMLGTTLKGLLGPLYAKNLPYIQAAYGGQTQVFERDIPTPDGTVRHSLVTYVPHIEDSHVSGIFVHVADVTHLKQLEVELKIEKQRLESIVKGTNIGSWEWNIQTGATVFSERWAEIIGYTLKEISPISIDTWERFAHPNDLKGSGEQLQKHFKGERDFYEFESRMKHKDGSWVWVLDIGKVFSWTDDGKPLMMYGARQDITGRKLREQTINELKDRLEKLAINDQLTGLLNRRGWEDCVALEESRAKRYNISTCVIMIDLDGLKKVNDTQGHKMGDDLIRRAAHCFKKAARVPDRVARIGGDEFAILATECTEEGGIHIMKRIESNLSEEGISASCGMAIRNDQGGLERAIAEADRLMYEMKARRRTMQGTGQATKENS
jgi:diguanylate cyclase (GGDEF)-like protein/PAS domain S-box-containing protein